MNPSNYNILIGCEQYGGVRDAFAELGFNAWSCDLLPDVNGSNRHIQDDIRNVMNDPEWEWDMLTVMHPPCTRLCNSGVRWLSEPPKGKTLDQMWTELDEGAALFSDCWNCDIPLVAVENPVMHKHAKERIRNFQPASQHIQPHWFGDPAFKSTGLYLRGLPELERTHWMDIPEKGTEEYRKWSAIHYASPGEDRWKIRSKTFDGVARAMAHQWGNFVLNNY